ncbi:hypothetical protein HOLleu_18705 [Holothuria leucospilota]|uniref:CCHC-type domain-containing protein n=1 Tax=Holothuria leucospilota TaxID=206669 RepID=A0A9Q1H9C4_HOLLE|nr:hypothetical protein HOLleu_18705 [Holothuria leucospilota]
MAKFPEMRWEATDVAEEFKLFKQRMELCFLDHGITDTSKQAIKIKIAVGNTGLRTINSSGLTAQDQTDPTKLWNLFESQLKIKVNFRIHRLELMNFRQKQNETLDEFVNRCRHKAKECDFTDDELSERIIELVIASAKCESFQRDLLDKPKGYSLDNVLKEGRKYEAISAGKQCLQSLDTGPSVSVIKSKKPCGNCGLFHPPKQCPAYNDVCKACGNKGHWAKMCRKSKRMFRKQGYKHPTKEHKDQHMGKHTKPQYRHTNRNRGGKPVQYHEVDSYDSDDQMFEASFDIIMSNMCLDTINKHQREEAFTTLDVMCPELKGKHHLKLKIDTGANGNALPLRTVKQIPAVAGLPLCEALKLVTIHTYTARPKPKVTNVQDLVKHYPDRFDTIGSFKTAAKLVLKEDATPSIDPPRKCSIHLKDKLKAELDKMERDGIIRKVTHHTDWCSSLTTVIKTDGTLRVCLDPKRLNQNLKRCPHKIPTLEELNPAFAKANYFSKLDAKAGYCIKETDEGPNIDLINFGTQKQDALRKETSQDPCLRALCQVITTGWPGTCKELPTDLRPFWTYRDELGMADGVIFKGRQVLIPKPLQADILNQLHNGHQGIEKTRRLARECVYWPNINRDIEKLVSSCSICQELQPSQTREPLEPHEIPSTPWTKLATDLFTLDPNLPSPAEILFGRPVRTTLPSNHPPQITQKSQQVYEQLNERRGRMKGHHDTKVKVKDLPPLYPGQKVRILDYERKTWSPGEVIKVCQEPRSYDIRTPNGSILRRNRQHLRELRHATPQPHHTTPQPQHTSPQPHSTPQVHTSKVPKQLNFANGNNVQAPPKVWATNEHERKGTVKTRSGRIVVPPKRYLPEV